MYRLDSVLIRWVLEMMSIGLKGMFTSGTALPSCRTGTGMPELCGLALDFPLDKSGFRATVRRYCCSCPSASAPHHACILSLFFSLCYSVLTCQQTMATGGKKSSLARPFSRVIFHRCRAHDRAEVCCSKRWRGKRGKKAPSGAGGCTASRS